MILGDKIKETKYLIFIIVKIKQKTVIVNIYNKSQNDLIAEIVWYNPWRQYCFCPGYGTVWNNQCLSDVNTVIESLKKNHSSGRN